MGAFLLAMAQPILARIIISLGMTVLTLTGVMEAYSTLKGMIQDNINQAPAAALQLAALAGVPDGLAMVLGAVSFVVSLWLATSATKMVFK